MNQRHRVTPADLIETHLARLPNTRRGYRSDLMALAVWKKAPSLEAAVGAMIGRGRAQCRRQLLAWLADMQAHGLAANTIRRRIATVTSLVTLAADLGGIPWTVGRLPLPAPARVKEGEGPGRAVIDRMFAACHKRKDAKGQRDAAILALLYCQGLQAGEVLSILAQDVNTRGRSVRIVGRGGRGREPLTLCARAVADVERWLEARGDSPGPLFTTCDPRAKAGVDGLSYRGLYMIVQSLGERAGGRCSPQALRRVARAQRPAAEAVPGYRNVG